ncbi:MAG: serine/threonine protein kinase [Roseburia sp.]|nr:serine/threonine protein kinase [Roseburia sp.]
MERLTTCKGCFAEWNEVDFQCFWCGWCPDMEEAVSDYDSGWKIGDMLANRYQLGKIYVRTDDGYTVWRAYDHSLEIPCFLLVTQTENIHWLMKIAWGFCGQPTCGIKVLGLREIEGNYALVLSMKNQYLDIETFRRLIQPQTEPPEPLFGEVAYQMNEEVREQVLPIDTLLGNCYRIAGCIGVGGFGIIYLCEDVLLQRNVAVKEYFPEQWAQREETYVDIRESGMLEAYRFGLQSLLKEAKITAHFIQSPHIGTIYDVFEENDTAYLVMEYLTGSSIGKEFKKWNNTPYKPHEMAEIMSPVLKALEEIHKQGIVHSDLSPGNIMRTKKGDITLIDFGAAKYSRDDQPAISAAFLKTDYAAPEQYRTAKEGRAEDEGPWTDIYAVGAMMYYFLTGHKPSSALARLSGNSTELVSPKEYGVKLKKGWMRLIHRCMELEYSRRISSVRTVREELKKLLAHEKEGR